MESSEVIKAVSEEPSTSQPMEVHDDEKKEEKGEYVTAINQMEIQSEPLQFVGLGKEDLLILANRPFWVRLRWALFISFWLLWLGLLVGAALLIALSPGCVDNDDQITTTSASSASHHR